MSSRRHVSTQAVPLLKDVATQTDEVAMQTQAPAETVEAAQLAERGAKRQLSATAEPTQQVPPWKAKSRRREGDGNASSSHVWERKANDDEESDSGSDDTSQLPILLVSHSVERHVSNCFAGYNALCFRDTGSYKLRRHDGRHHEIQQRIIKYQPEALLALLEAVLEDVAVAENEGMHAKVTISLMCRQGRHRSVAVAELLRQFLHDAGYVKTEVMHLEFPDKACVCKDCKPLTEETRSMLVDLALKHF